jgi:anti-sigma factor RsiW
MKTCSQCQPLLADYVDGHLNPIDRQHVDAHLADCPTCRSRLAGARWLSSRLHQATGEWPIEQLLVWPTQPAAPRLRSLQRRVLVAAGLAALVAVAFWFRPPFDPMHETAAARPATERASANDDHKFADLKAAIAREACAAELAMSAELLAAEPAVNRYAAEALRFVAETFPDTKAGRDAARRGAPASPPARESL